MGEKNQVGSHLDKMTIFYQDTSKKIERGIFGCGAVNAAYFFLYYFAP